MMAEVSRKRSPNYPGISLEDAILFARRFYNSAHQSPVDKESAFRMIGYRGESGRSLSVLSAIKKFELIEGDSDSLRVTDFALRILEPSDQSEEKEAIQEAARKPEIYRDVLEYCGGKVPPSDEPIRAYLIRQRGFGQKGADSFLRAFRATFEFAGLQKSEGGGKSTPRVLEIRSNSNLGIDGVGNLTSVGNREPFDSDEIDEVPIKNSEKLILRISPLATAEILLKGKITQSGIRKLISYLEISLDNYVDE